jgi:hypothetical protein
VVRPVGTGSAVSVPTDIELPLHPEAAWAALHRMGDGWALTFTGREPFAGAQITIPPAALTDAGVDPSLDHLVSGDVETRLWAAGYGIAPWDERPGDALEGWTLRH